MTLEYTTEIAGERFGADERAQFEVTIDEDGIKVRDKLYHKEVTMKHADFAQLLDLVRAYRNAIDLLGSV
jgi:hypothetical protein